MYFETQKLSVGYHRRPLIEDIDIGIWQGGILCLIGPNGSGKSTICLLYTSSWSGRIWRPSRRVGWPASTAG